MWCAMTCVTASDSTSVTLRVLGFRRGEALCGPRRAAGDPPPRFRAPSPAPASDAARGRSLAHTCAGNSPAAVCPGFPCDPPARPALRIRTTVPRSSLNIPRSSAVALHFRSDIPTLAAPAHTSVRSPSSARPAASSPALRVAGARCKSSEIHPAPPATEPSVAAYHDVGSLPPGCDEIAPLSLASADDAPDSTTVRSPVRSDSLIARSVRSRSSCSTTPNRDPSTSHPVRRSARRCPPSRDKCDPRETPATHTNPPRSGCDHPGSTADNTSHPARNTPPCRPSATTGSARLAQSVTARARWNLFHGPVRGASECGGSFSQSAACLLPATTLPASSPPIQILAAAPPRVLRSAERSAQDCARAFGCVPPPP